MTEARPLMPMLAALFCVVAGGQFLSLFAEPRSLRPETIAPVTVRPAVQEPHITQTGVHIIDERVHQGSVDDQETELRAEAYALKKERAQIDREREKLEQARRQLSGDATKTHAQLAAIYQQMPAAKAAAVLVELEAQEAATFLVLMSGDAGAEILAAMPADAAVKISREIVKRSKSSITLASD